MVSVAKISGTFILFAISFLFGLLPYFIIKCAGRRFKGSENYKYFLSILNCFSGGVFFATTIMNLLPEALELMAEVLKEAAERGFDIEFKEYPITEALLGAGFFLIHLIENIVNVFCVQTSKKEKVKRANCHNKSNSAKMAIEIDKKSQVFNGVIESAIGRESNKGETTTVSMYENETEFTQAEEIPKESVRPHVIVKRTHPEAAVVSVTQVYDQENHVKDYGTITKDSKNDMKNFANNEHMLTNDDSITSAWAPFRKLRTVILLIALSLHMVFDGLALGLQKKDPRVWQLLGALAVHKSIVSFSVGLKLVETIPSIVAVLGLLTLVSIVSPLGMILGIVITSTEGIDSISRDLVSAILQGIATGTFMYVTFFEILLREFQETRDFRKAVALFVGFVIIAVVKFLDN